MNKDFQKGEEIRKNNPAAKEYEEATKQLVQASLWSHLVALW